MKLLHDFAFLRALRGLRPSERKANRKPRTITVPAPLSAVQAATKVVPLPRPKTATPAARPSLTSKRHSVLLSRQA